MRSNNIDLQAAIILTTLAIIFILVPPFNKTFLRVVLSLPLLFFIPGYVLMAALFPRKEGLDGVERVLFSFGSSLAMVSFVGFGLNFTDYGITLIPVISVLYVLILLIAGVSIVRRGRTPEQDRFTVNWNRWIKSIREEGIFPDEGPKGGK